ncbi:MAG: hypothetical protein ACLPVY_01115 [Acidimicrobiia bacterium]
MPASYNTAALREARIGVHLVAAFLTARRLGDVTVALNGRGVGGVTVSGVQGFGGQGRLREVHRGSQTTSTTCPTAGGGDRRRALILGQHL